MHRNPPTNGQPSRHPRSSTPPRRARSLTLAAVCALLVVATACGSDEGAKGGKGGSDARGVVVVNAPSAGEVRRVLVGEGASVGEGDPVVEIAVRAETPAAPQPSAEDPVARAAQNIQSSEAEIDAARAEVVRAEVDVQRLTPLVAAGQASQGELDAARGDYDRAQQRLQRAQTAAQGAQGGLVAARQQSRNSTRPAPTPAEQLVAARATSAGTVTAVSVRPGDRVTAGQPLATLRAGTK